VNHLSAVADSILGRNVNFGARNRRHDAADDADVFTGQGERLSTGRRTFGVVAGDGRRPASTRVWTPGLKFRDRRDHGTRVKRSTGIDDGRDPIRQLPAN